ncbi:hypothetical protein EG028_06650 [Chitinophaga barathri]|uniref:Uncharacterized protein n=1 Tax=Chitinophaga barathri TaxID=1647451 RepID=A0A3N4MQ88_9BACT|nr:hypothetical protein EG028_06650 [Chitinophaga barathri]
MDQFAEVVFCRPFYTNPGRTSGRDFFIPAHPAPLQRFRLLKKRKIILKNFTLFKGFDVFNVTSFICLSG